MTATPKRPQCTRLAASFYVETAYGTVFNDSAITKLFTPVVPAILDLAMTADSDAEDIKGHEFPEDVDRDVLVTQDVQLPVQFPSTLSCLGWLMSLISGADSVVSSSPVFTHTFKIQDMCTSDQPPSTNLIAGFVGDVNSFYKMKGACLNELKITCDKPGNLTVNCTFISDGSLTVRSSYTFPTTTSHSKLLRGTQADFFTANHGVTPVTKKDLFLGFDFTYSLNLDTADGRAAYAYNNDAYLHALRFGNRAISLIVRVQGHQGDEFWVDHLARTAKDTYVKVSYDASNYIKIQLPLCKIDSIKESFAGIRDQNELTYKAFYHASDSSPVIVVVANDVAAYLLPITVGM
jgi:hypothetical protein